MESLFFGAEYQPYISQQGSSDLRQANWTGNGYSLYNVTNMTVRTLAGAVDDGVPMPSDARHAWLSITGGSIRVRTDGVDPSATRGLLLPSGTLLPVENQRQFLEQLRFIATSATVEVSAMWFL